MIGDHIRAVRECSEAVTLLILSDKNELFYTSFSDILFSRPPSC